MRDIVNVDHLFIFLTHIMNLSRSALLPYSASKMYQVVTDIASYPEFLYGCSDANVLEQKIVSETVEEVTALVHVNYAKLNLQFTTRNLNTLNQSIELNLVDGPFSSMKGFWEFEPLSEEACKVSLNISFQFKNLVMNKMLSPIFGKLVEKQFEAFQLRAAKLYG